ncbi:MAG: ATP cone domain-containing protein [Bacilli bacterium]
MVAEKEELLETLNVVKRNGKKVSFDGSKIAIAIKKGFDSVKAEDENGEVLKNTLKKMFIKYIIL